MSATPARGGRPAKNNNTRVGGMEHGAQATEGGKSIEYKTHGEPGRARAKGGTYKGHMRMGKYREMNKHFLKGPSKPRKCVSLR